jgi:predicted ArsR family transcriptional regulator
MFRMRALHPPTKTLHGNVFRGTRGQVLGLLRGQSLTVAELAEKLGLTGNAVRGHLAALERDQLVEVRGSRRGVAKPSILYGLTPGAQALFPKAYGLVMGAVLDEVRERSTPAQLAGMLRAVGRRLAGVHAGRGRSLNARLQTAAATLTSLGGVAQVEKTASGYVISCHDCPLPDVASEHIETCAIVNAILSEIVGVELSTRCAGGARPGCHFELKGK